MSESQSVSGKSDFGCPANLNLLVLNKFSDALTVSRAGGERSDCLVATKDALRRLTKEQEQRMHEMSDKTQRMFFSGLLGIFRHKNDNMLCFAELVREARLFRKELMIFVVESVVCVSTANFEIHEENTKLFSKMVKGSLLFSPKTDLTAPIGDDSVNSETRNAKWNTMFMANYSLTRPLVQNGLFEFITPFVFGSVFSVVAKIENEVTSTNVTVLQRSSILDALAIDQSDRLFQRVFTTHQMQRIEIFVTFGKRIKSICIDFVSLPQSETVNEFRMRRFFDVLKKFNGSEKAVLIDDGFKSVERYTELIVAGRLGSSRFTRRKSTALKIMQETKFEELDLRMKIGRFLDKMGVFNKHQQEVSERQFSKITVESFANEKAFFEYLIELFDSCKSSISPISFVHPSADFLVKGKLALIAATFAFYVRAHPEPYPEPLLTRPSQRHQYISLRTKSIDVNGYRSLNRRSTERSNSNRRRISELTINQLRHSNFKLTDKDFAAVQNQFELKLMSQRSNPSKIDQTHAFFNEYNKQEFMGNLINNLSILDKSAAQKAIEYAQYKELINSSIGGLFFKLKEKLNNVRSTATAHFEKIKLCIVTYNLSGFKPTDDNFDKLQFLEDSTVASSDLLIINFQECILMKASSLPSIIWEQNDNELNKVWQFLLTQKLKGFYFVFRKQLCGLLTFVFARCSTRLEMDVEVVKEDALRLGRFYLANKGCLSLTLRVNNDYFVFTNCHLASGISQKHFEARNDNLKDILEWLKQTTDKPSAVFLSGDFNYRVDKNYDEARQFFEKLRRLEETKTKLLKGKEKLTAIVARAQEKLAAKNKQEELKNQMSLPDDLPGHSRSRAISSTFKNEGEVVNHSFKVDEDAKSYIIDEKVPLASSIDKEKPKDGQPDANETMNQEEEAEYTRRAGKSLQMLQKSVIKESQLNPLTMNVSRVPTNIVDSEFVLEDSENQSEQPSEEQTESLVESEIFVQKLPEMRQSEVVKVEIPKVIVTKSTPDENELLQKLEEELRLLDERQFDLMYSYKKKDEFIKAQQLIPIFRELASPVIHFKPTYRYFVNSKEYDYANGQRIPSWTDRILVWNVQQRCFDGEEYKSSEETMISDHKPVILLGTLSVKSVNVTELYDLFDRV